MPENVVRFRPSTWPAAQDGDEDSRADPTREYILDMIEQLAALARRDGDPVLGAQLEGVLQRQARSRARDSGS